MLCATQTVNSSYAEVVLIDRSPDKFWNTGSVVICRYGPIAEPNASLHVNVKEPREMTAEGLCHRVCLYMARKEGPKLRDLVSDRFWQTFIDDVKTLSVIHQVSDS